MILYFSGSGNSLAIARRLADKLNEQIIPLHEAVSLNLSNEKRIGLVYPTYWLDAAKPVRDLVPKLNISPTAYVFIVITCGAQTNNAVWSVRKLLSRKGIKVAYCNKIRVPDSSALGFGRDPNKQLWKFDKYEPRLPSFLPTSGYGTQSQAYIKGIAVPSSRHSVKGYAKEAIDCFIFAVFYKLHKTILNY